MWQCIIKCQRESGVATPICQKMSSLGINSANIWYNRVLFTSTGTKIEDLECIEKVFVLTLEERFFSLGDERSV